MRPSRQLTTRCHLLVASYDEEDEHPSLTMHRYVAHTSLMHYTALPPPHHHHSSRTCFCRWPKTPDSPCCSLGRCKFFRLEARPKISALHHTTMDGMSAGELEAYREELRQVSTTNPPSPAAAFALAFALLLTGRVMNRAAVQYPQFYTFTCTSCTFVPLPTTTTTTDLPTHASFAQLADTRSARGGTRQ